MGRSAKNHRPPDLLYRPGTGLRGTGLPVTGLRGTGTIERRGPGWQRITGELSDPAGILTWPDGNRLGRTDNQTRNPRFDAGFFVLAGRCQRSPGCLADCISGCQTAARRENIEYPGMLSGGDLVESRSKSG